jgi:excisionase family DNA binding protein
MRSEPPTDSAETLLVDRTEAARQLCCCARTIDKLIRAGQLRAVRIARRVLISRAELERFITASQNGGAR